MSMKSKTAAFFKKNIYYILLAFCLVAIGTVITLAVVLDKKPAPASITPDPPGPEEPIDTTPEPFLFPVAGNYVLGHSFTGEDDFVWSSVNLWYEAHLGVDFKVDAGTEVLSMHDGTVLKVEDDYLDGLVVQIRYDDGIIATYKALDTENILVEQGQTVNRGEVIGTVARKTLGEINHGSHLHLEVYSESAETEIDPMDLFEEYNK